MPMTSMSDFRVFSPDACAGCSCGHMWESSVDNRDCLAYKPPFDRRAWVNLVGNYDRRSCLSGHFPHITRKFPSQSVAIELETLNGSTAEAVFSPSPPFPRSPCLSGRPCRSPHALKGIERKIDEPTRFDGPGGFGRRRIQHAKARVDLCVASKPNRPGRADLRLSLIHI